MSILSRLPRPRTRAGKILTGLVGFLVAAGVGVALAALLGIAHITGGVSSGNFSPVWSTATATGSGSTCTANVTGAGTLDLHVNGALPGGSCTVDGTVALAPGATVTGRVAGVALTLPDGWTATLTQGCGALVDVSPATPVTIKVTMTPDAAPGSAGTFGSADGVTVQPTSDGVPVCS